MVAKLATCLGTPFGEGGSYLTRAMFAGSKAARRFSWGMRWRVEKNMVDLACGKCGGAVLFQKVSSRSPAVILMPGLSSFGDNW